MEALNIIGLTKTYKTGTKALKGVDLTVEAGSITALLGANGAGKTTLIAILTGLVNKSSGTISVFEHSIDSDPETVRSMIGIVPQEFNFSIFEKVEEIVLNQAGYYGVPREKARARTEFLLKELGLWEKRSSVSRTLSGGMKRRLMIARALVHEPRLLLLDEPSAGVDVELRHGMWEFIRKIHAAGTTVIMTTHYLEEAENLCENVVIMKKGEIIKSGAVKVLLRDAKEQSFVVTVVRPSGTEEIVDVSLVDGQSVTDYVQKLAADGTIVRDIRPKANRLEELFLEVNS
ncbi:MAG: ABC transporter ATP-binding protein [Candidatus Uhrbacteria bacterium]